MESESSLIVTDYFEVEVDGKKVFKKVYRKVKPQTYDSTEHERYNIEVGDDSPEGDEIAQIEDFVIVGNKVS